MRTPPPEAGAPDPSAALAEQVRAMQAFPAELAARKQWLLWRFLSYAGDKKPRKVPFYADGRKRHGEQGSADDRAALVDLPVALAVLQQGGWSGVGFAFLPGDGLIGIDIDGAIDDDGVVSARCQAIVDACASYTEYSPSGRGVHIIVAGQSETFKDNRVGLEVFCGRQFFTCTGRHWPGAPNDVRPLAEGTLRRLRATVRSGKAARSAQRQDLARRPAGGELTAWLEQALQVIDSGAVSYDEWIGIGMALKSALGDGGFSLWDYWSSKGGERYPGATKLGTHWRSFPQTDADGALTIFKMARKGNAWRPPKAWHDAYGTPRRGREAPASTPSTGSAGDGGGGAPPDEPPDEEWRDGLIRGPGGGKKDCRENVFLELTCNPLLKGLVGYDEFSHRVMKLRQVPWDSPLGEWTTNDDYFLGLWLARKERLPIKSEGTLVAGVAMAAFANRFHPVLRYLEELPEWDGVERLRHWLHECLGAADTTYTQLVGTWFILGMVKRVQSPGCQMDYMIVLEGLQGKRKSTALRTLVGNNDWFADTPIRVGDKDALLSLAGKWLYEVGELDAFNRAEVTAVKQYISSRIDRVREPYERRSADRPRSGVLAGSTNQSEYFKDPTGARRFWPVACDGDIDVAKLAEWRAQLFAEAKHRLASADPEDRRYYPTREETEKFLEPEQERREIVDPWFERLSWWLRSTSEMGEREVRHIESFTANELLTKCLQVPQDRIDGGRQMSTRVGIAMHKLGWEKRRDATGDRLWRYWRPKAAPQQQAALAGSDEAAGGPAEVDDDLEF